MRYPANLLRQVRARNPQVQTVPAPVGGWNARDSLDTMRQEDAIQLDNFFPGLGRVELRKGYEQYSTGVGSGAVETLAEYHAGATRKMLAAGGGAIYDASSSTASSLKSGFSVDRWQWVNFNGTMGLVNGTDAPQTYDGSTVSAMTVSGSGLTVSNLIGINVFKSRTYFWEANSQDFWYSAVNALGGSLTKFPLSRVGQFGGNLIAMGTWTRDGGAGMDDLAVFMMSSGEVIVYQGSDPGTAADWSLVGIFRIGAPVNVRAITKVGGDLVVATRDGYQSLSAALPVGRAQKAAISDKIRNAAIQQVADSGDSFGWQITLYPKGNMALVNYPIGGTFQQHVMNLTTGAWCRFKGIAANCFLVYNDHLYFGGAGGVVYKADTGFDDNGSNIEADASTAFTYLGSRNRLKRISMVRPVVASDGDLPLSVVVDTDFSNKVKPYVTSTYSASGATWGVTAWDVAEWIGGIQSKPKWMVATGHGYNASLRLRTRTSAQSVYWYATGYAIEPGGVL